MKPSRRTSGVPIPPSPLVEGPELTLRPEDRLVDAAYRVLLRHFGRLVWNEPGTREGTDAEYLHDMRVAARRLRAALGVFKKALPPARVTWARENLRRLGRALGAVRDLDVQLARLDDDVREFPEAFRDVLAIYRGHLRARRERARAAMLRRLSGRAHAAFLASFARWLKAGPPTRANAAGRARAATAGARIVKKRLKKALRSGRRLNAGSTDAALHAERIRLKRLRYACEFFADLLGPNATKFAVRVTDLQDALGAQHDAVVAQTMLAAAGKTGPGPLTASGVRDPFFPAPLRRQAFMMLGHLMAQQAHRARSSRDEFLRLWKRFDRMRTRRPLKRALKSRLDGPPAKTG